VNQLFNGKAEDVLKELPKEIIDLTITSPPYDSARHYKDFIFDFEDIAKELYRVTKKGGVVVWIVNDSTINGSETGTSFRQALYFKDIGFRLHDTMIFAKNNYCPLTHERYEQSFEYMFILSKGKPKTFNPIMIPCKSVGKTEDRNRYTCESVTTEKGCRVRKREEITTVKDTKIKENIWYYTTGSKAKGRDKYGNMHPAVFPEELVKDHILSWSNEEDLILDPLSGSGTTLKMAYILKRNYIGIEMSEDYCKIIDERMRELKNDNLIF
jgi:DNA modification methylase